VAFGGAATAVIQLVLTGHQQVMAGLSATGQQLGKLQRATQSWGTDLDAANKRGWLMNQALFTMRRYAYAATLGLTGLASAAVYMGLRFNASMEQNQVAFEQLMGSASGARKEIGFLYNLAKVTPFEFANVTDAARRFLAFGFTVKQTNENLKVIGDTVAAFGGGGAQIERMVTVFGQIRASGRLLGQDLLQLEQQGIPVIDILTQKLAKYGVTRAMLSRPGELQIPAEIGIPALMQGMQERFRGASARQAKTVMGQLSTMHDSVAQIMGMLTKGIFASAQKGLFPQLNKLFDQITARAKKHGNKVSISEILGMGAKQFPQVAPLLRFINALLQLGKQLWVLFKNSLLPILMVIAWALGTLLLPAFIWFVKALTWVNKYTKILLPVMAYLIGLLIYERIAAMLAADYTGKLAFTMKVLRFFTRAATYAYSAFNWVLKGNLVAMIRLRLAVWTTAIALWWQRQAALQAALAWVRLRLATWAAAIAMWWANSAIRATLASLWALVLENPIGLIVVGVFLLVAGLVILYFKWKWFHNLVNNTAKWIWKHWKLVAGILFVIAGPLGLMIALSLVIAKNWKLIWGWIQKVWNLMKDAVNWIKNNWKIVGAVLIAPFAPMLAAVAAVVWGLKKIVGWAEKALGPLKRAWGWAKKAFWWTAHGVGNVATSTWNAASGQPMGLGGSPLAAPAAGGGAIPLSGANQLFQSVTAGKAQQRPWDVTVHSNVHIDGKKVAESTSKHRQNRKARQ